MSKEGRMVAVIAPDKVWGLSGLNRASSSPSIDAVMARTSERGEFSSSPLFQMENYQKELASVCKLCQVDVFRMQRRKTGSREVVREHALAHALVRVSGAFLRPAPSAFIYSLTYAEDCGDVRCSSLTNRESCSTTTLTLRSFVFSL
ncbi:uncharacterized [Tachysurus ichikawai]